MNEASKSIRVVDKKCTILKTFRVKKIIIATSTKIFYRKMIKFYTVYK